MSDILQNVDGNIAVRKWVTAERSSHKKPGTLKLLTSHFIIIITITVRTMKTTSAGVRGRMPNGYCEQLTNMYYTPLKQSIQQQMFHGYRTNTSNTEVVLLPKFLIGLL